MTAAWILDFLNRRAKVEQEMLDAAKWIVIERPDRALDAQQLRDWALRLGVPEDAEFGRAVAESAPEPVTLSRLRQMLEDYRDAWSPGARDELFAQYRAEIAAIEREGGRSVIKLKELIDPTSEQIIQKSHHLPAWPSNSAVETAAFVMVTVWGILAIGIACVLVWFFIAYRR